MLVRARLERRRDIREDEAPPRADVVDQLVRIRAQSPVGVGACEPRTDADRAEGLRRSLAVSQPG